ncbi:putative choline kinase [Rosellinia necatrix]|uniref:Putative choline kinase n=1 Tax=Rosellinia necatrix TaxID=77044 RepID=A0A1S8AB54_ROSNE|nr:putative choline kinase [Rosellinia necatrix]
MLRQRLYCIEFARTSSTESRLIFVVIYPSLNLARLLNNQVKTKTELWPCQFSQHSDKFYNLESFHGPPSFVAK